MIARQRFRVKGFDSGPAAATATPAVGDGMPKKKSNFSDGPPAGFLDAKNKAEQLFEYGLVKITNTVDVNAINGFD